MKKIYLRKLMIIAAPLMLSNVISQIQMIIDKIFLGQMDKLYMSALGNVTSPIWTTMSFSLILVAIGAGKEQMRSLRVWAVICLFAMLIGPIGTALLPKAVFGLFERFGTFSAVVFNAVLGIFLMKGQFETSELSCRVVEGLDTVGGGI